MSSPRSVRSRTLLECPAYSPCAHTLPQAQSGTGKTATFSISMLQAIDSSVRDTQALVLSPTRELATQIQSVVLALGGEFGGALEAQSILD